MPSRMWSKLNHLQLGRYAEYYAKMEFASYGYDVYTSEVDDHGVDFVVKDLKGRFNKIQVKSIRNYNYTFMAQDKFDLNNRGLYLVLLIFTDGEMPNIYLIPTYAWRIDSPVFKVNNYDKEGQISKPEYGLNISRKNMIYLEEYRFENMIEKLL